jgi:hypothetical protein
MLRAPGPTYIPPVDDERERRPPYRRLWRTATIEAILLLVPTAAVLGLERLGVSLGSGTTLQAFRVAFALLPLVLWFIFSFVGEYQSRNPRHGLLIVLIVSALGANAIGVPLAERLFAVDTWLSTATGATRIIGYMVTISITQEFIKYAAVRYSVWPNAIRVRIDGPAYMLTAAIGYATVLNLNYVFNENALPSATVLRIAEFTLSQVAVSTIMGFFLSEMKLSVLPAITLPAGLLLASLVNALSITLRAGLVVGPISPTTTASVPAQGLGVPILLLVFLFTAFNFLINNADERETLRLRGERQ